MSDSRLTETPLSSEVVYNGVIFSVEKRAVRLSNGREARRDIVINPGAAAVVALDNDDNVILVRQFRAAQNKIMAEIPAGKLDAGEDPLLCAKRELSEETGLSATEWVKLSAACSSPGFSTEILHIYLARGLSAGSVHPDEDEFVEIEKKPLSEAMEMIFDGRIDDMKSIVGITMAFYSRKRQS